MQLLNSGLSFISMVRVDMRYVQVSNKLLKRIFISYKTHIYGVICIDVIAKNTEIISDLLLILLKKIGNARPGEGD